MTTQKNLTESSWTSQLQKVVTELMKINARRDDLLRERRELIAIGFLREFDSQVGMAKLTGLSRGRIQQLINAPVADGDGE